MARFFSGCAGGARWFRPALVGLAGVVAVRAAPPADRRWDFDHLKDWAVESQDGNPATQIENKVGMVRIWTRAGSKDRKKIHTIAKVYTTGRYRWRTYIPKFGVGDRASVGSWIYCDDQHEIDFEVGHGKAKERLKYRAKPGEALAYMTTQAGPYSSVAFPIAMDAWHEFEIDITLKDGRYAVQWFIDGKPRHAVTQTYGAPYAFHLYCSVENLDFIGDTPASKDTVGLFDRVEYRYHP